MAVDPLVTLSLAPRNVFFDFAFFQKPQDSVMNRRHLVRVLIQMESLFSELIANFRGREASGDCSFEGEADCVCQTEVKLTRHRRLGGKVSAKFRKIFDGGSQLGNLFVNVAAFRQQFNHLGASSLESLFVGFVCHG